jgi:hypothetical protein
MLNGICRSQNTLHVRSLIGNQAHIRLSTHGTVRIVTGNHELTDLPISRQTALDINSDKAD